MTLLDLALIILYGCVAFLGGIIIGIKIGKRSRKIKLVGLGAKEAFAYFLLHEIHRHRKDIAQAKNDLKKLDRAGVMAPDIPVGLWIEVHK